MNKLEIGCGERPTPGYIHNDVNSFPDVEIVGNPWEITIEEGSLDEVMALAVIEHLTYSQVDMCFANVHRMLRKGGSFYFDVPDILTWCRYLVNHFDGLSVPFSIEHVLSTIYGWQRWPGDEHKSGWYKEKLVDALHRAQFYELEFGVEIFLSRGVERNRMKNTHNVHIYCRAEKT